jgi:dienelactone hydrolase
LDAKAATDAASQLEGVDSHQVVAIGASIGADGAADSCFLHNTQATTCVGALSLSPGNYLT